jgi:uncharacterized protein (UPF0210 family)
MKIRTVTLGVKGEQQCNAFLEGSIKSFFETVETLFSEEQFTLRTKRITLEPAVVDTPTQSENVWKSIEAFSVLCKNLQIRWFCVPFQAFKQNYQAINDIAVKLVAEYKNAFVNYIVTDNGRVDTKAVLYASNFVKSVSGLSDNGFDNFRCGASFNCNANGAFFPFTYHRGKNGFSVSLEIVPLFVDIIKSSKTRSIQEIRSSIVDELVPILRRVNQICTKAAGLTGMEYYGIDASLAPHPEHPEHSVAFLVEQLGVEQFGSSGTSFITSYLTDIIKSVISFSGIKTTGFNGIMYSVLEDARLGVVNNDGQGLSIDSLLAFSTMCGCGIDMVPIPGDTSEEEIASIMLDISAVATRLGKPLGVRLLPIPGKTGGEFTNFNHDFLHNTKIQNVKNLACLRKIFEADKPFAYLL